MGAAKDHWLGIEAGAGQEKSQRQALPACRDWERIPEYEGLLMQIGSTDYLLPELAVLLATATREIDRYTNDEGWCADCGSVFPCKRALLAEHNLAVL